MRIGTWVVGLVSLLACGHDGGALRAPDPPASSRPAAPSDYSLVIVNAKVWSDPPLPDANALALRGPAIAKVGSASELGSGCSGSCSLVDAHGKFLMPGFHDAHVHLYMAGAEAATLAVPLAPVSAIQGALRSWAAARPDDPW